MNEEQIKQRLLEIEKELEVLEEAVDIKDNLWTANGNMDKPFEKYWEFIKSEKQQMAKLDRERRMIMTYELSDLPDYGDVMPLKEFIECVNDGGFIDYDGFGCYVKDGKETNIWIYPSDVKYNSIRPDFDTIIWYNR
jgi:hypothetical protein